MLSGVPRSSSDRGLVDRTSWRGLGQLPKKLAAGPRVLARIELSRTQSDDSGSVTFSDSTGHNVGVTITNGLPASSTVDLSGLTDGTITATLHLNNDAAGNSFTNVVTTATLDRDTALKLTVNGGAPIGAATAAATPPTKAMSHAVLQSPDECVGDVLSAPP